MPCFIRKARKADDAPSALSIIMKFPVKVKFRGASHIGVIKGFAQFTVLGVLKHSQVVRHLKRDAVTLLIVGFGRFFKGRDIVSGNSCQFFFVFN